VTESTAPALSIEPVISWPREATPGQRYLLTIDLRTSPVGEEWALEDEEVEFRCLLDAYPLFISSPLDEPVLVVHRFGGTYRPVRYLLEAQSFGADDAPEAVWVTLTTRWGVPVRTIELPVRLVTERPRPAQGTLLLPDATHSPSLWLPITVLPEQPMPVDVPEPMLEPDLERRPWTTPDRPMLLDVRAITDLPQQHWELATESRPLIVGQESSPPRAVSGF